MKLATYLDAQGRPRIGAVDVATQTLLDLQAAHQALKGQASAHLGSMLDLIDGGPAALDLAREVERQGAAAKR